jgi:hypothetical protein
MMIMVKITRTFMKNHGGGIDDSTHRGYKARQDYFSSDYNGIYSSVYPTLGFRLVRRIYGEKD